MSPIDWGEAKVPASGESWKFDGVANLTPREDLSHITCPYCNTEINTRYFEIWGLLTIETDMDKMTATFKTQCLTCGAELTVTASLINPIASD